MKSHRLQRRACTEATLLNSFRYFDSLSLSLNGPVIVSRLRVLPLLLSLRSMDMFEAISCLYISLSYIERERKLKVYINTS